jgi:stringent starvation protein B
MLRAMHQWMTDSGLTPHVIVNAGAPGVAVPAAYIKDGKIVLNLSYTATQRLEIANDWVECDARFAGVIHHIRFPVSAVLGVYARETGEGMVFSAADGGSEPPDGSPRDGPDRPTAGDEGARRPQLKIVK